MCKPHVLTTIRDALQEARRLAEDSVTVGRISPQVYRRCLFGFAVAEAWLEGSQAYPLLAKFTIRKALQMSLRTVEKRVDSGMVPPHVLEVGRAAAYEARLYLLGLAGEG